MTSRRLTETQRNALNYLLVYPYRNAVLHSVKNPYGFTMPTWRSLAARHLILFSTNAFGLNVNITAAGIREIHPDVLEAGIDDVLKPAIDDPPSAPRAATRSPGRLDPHHARNAADTLEA